MNSLLGRGSACRKSVADARRCVTATLTGFSGIEVRTGIGPGGRVQARAAWASMKAAFGQPDASTMPAWMSSLEMIAPWASPC